MDFNNTSIDGRRARGFTLVELMVAMALAALLMMVVGTLALYSGRSFAALANYTDLDHASRNALDILTRDVRQTQKLSSFQTNELVFVDSDGQPLTYRYSAADGTFRRIKGGTSQLLLTECDYLKFSMYQRNPIGGEEYDVWWPALTADTCKLIEVSWICSRQIFGKKVNTESVQTAKIVIRKQ
jgi:prepilin-type N-terminal cleavage/methylation domain-containing protein